MNLNINKRHVTPLAHKHLTYGVLAIFLYVGAEVAVGSYLVNFFLQLDIPGMNQVTAGQMGLLIGGQLWWASGER